MQRIIGLILLSVGTGLAAVFGAWLPGSERDDHRARMAAAAHTAMAAEVKKQQNLSTTAADAPTQQRLARLAALPAPAAPTGPDGAALSPPIGAEGISLWAEEAGLPFGFGILLVIIGVVLARRGMRDDAEAASAESAKRGAAPGPLLAQLVEELTLLRDTYAGDSPDLVAVRADVERVQQSIVNPLVDGRDQISQAFGVGPYADVFVPFSAAERQLNRLWSACVDGYVDEIGPCLQRAVASARLAHEHYEKISAARTAS